MTGDGPTVVVLRANDVCHLGILRGLFRAGARVVEVVWTWPGARPFWSEASRVPRETVRIPNPADDPARAVAALEALGRRLVEETGTRPLVLPSSDTALMLVLDHHERLGRWFRMMGRADLDGAPGNVVDKAVCARALAAAGCPVPVTRGVSGPEDVVRAVRDVPTPAVFKPAVKDYGMRFYARHRRAKAVACPDRDALRRGLVGALADGFDVVAQERIPFRGAADEVPFYAYVDAGHRVRLGATAIKRSIHPAPFGTATVLELAWHPELVPVVEGVARSLRYRGILMVELIRDARDGAFRVIEVNPRPWLFVGFFQQQGLDYLGYLRDDLDGALDARRPVALRHPTPATLATPPVHVDLGDEWAALEERRGKPVTPPAFLDHLAAMPGRVSATWDDVDDPEPGRRRRAALARSRGMEPAARARLDALLGSDGAVADSGFPGGGTRAGAARLPRPATPSPEVTNP